MTTLTIERIGHRGDGVAAGPVFVPYTLPGERVEAEVAGERGRLEALVEPSPERVEPFCPWFTRCGGCAIQHWDGAAYAAWKRGLVVEALAAARLDAEVRPLVDAHGAGRRRATFHARRGLVGFAEARQHAIVPIDACPICVPELAGALDAARAVEKRLRGLGKPLDLLATATTTGLDIDLRGSGPLPAPMRLDLARLAETYDLARLSVHGEVVVERRAPRLRLGPADVLPPPGAFLQATEAADAVLAGLVLGAVAGARRVADLFAGVGTFSLPLAQASTVAAFDLAGPALAALTRAARSTPGLRPVTATTRDLFHRPLRPEELKAIDAVVFDPPRSGAEVQAKRLAASRVERVVAISCNPATFARDAGLLVAGGYRLGPVTPVDQFRHSAHVELVAAFTR